jgi:hypothetical protein
MRTTAQRSFQRMDEVDLVTRRNQSSTFTTSREVLHSWKEIAAELDRGVRTVQRWERTLRLPVRRLGDGPRSPVFAFKDELRFWLRTRGGNGTNGNSSLSDPQASGVTPSAGSHGSSQKVKTSSLRHIREKAEAKSRIIQSIRDFFDDAQSTRQKQQECVHCGSLMRFLDRDFWLYGTGMKWKIPVQYCPACDSELLGSLQLPGSVH